jgi:hypothetical protein
MRFEQPMLGIDGGGDGGFAERVDITLSRSEHLID